MRNNYPFNITPGDFKRMAQDSAEERHLWNVYIAAAANPASIPVDLTKHRENWHHAAAMLSENVSHILRMHLLVSDILEAGPGTKESAA